MAKNVVSALCLTLMVLVAGGVIGFYYYSGLGKEVVPVSIVSNNDLSKDLNVNEDKSAAKSFFSHDVLNKVSYCEVDEFYARGWEESTGGACTSAEYPGSAMDLLDVDFNSVYLMNDFLDYRVILNGDSKIVADIKDRLANNRLSLKEFEGKIDGRDAREKVIVQGVFDRQNPKTVYILFSYEGQVIEKPELINQGENEIASYVIENKIYKYDLSADNFEIVYHVNQIYGDKEIVLEADGVAIGLSHIKGINESNDLLLAGSQTFGMTGLGGGPYQFEFEGIAPRMNLYLLENGSGKLAEYKYNQDNDSYNADLYRFLLLEYYPKYFEFESTSGGPEDYSKF
ncbi:MAG TPA: hypothetical protein PL066_01380 [bacterium]|nr:hypothetical protein [bacterium]